jgi:hypothetical protein
VLAALLNEAAQLFAGYSDPDPPTTWRDVLRRYDPTDRLTDVQHRIGALDNYGLGGASFVEPSGEREQPIG